MPIYLQRTIAGRLYLVGGLALAAVVALASVSIYFAWSTGRAAEVLYQRSLVGAVDAGEIEVLLERHRRLIEAAPLEFNRQQIARDREMSEDVIRRIRGLAERKETTFGPRASDELASIADLGQQVLRLAENFAQDRALTIVAQYSRKAEELQQVLRDDRKRSVATAEQEAGALMDSAHRLVNAVSAITLAALVLIGPLAFFLLRSLIKRLHAITIAMQRLADHDTSISLEPQRSDDEIGAMAGAVEVFRANAVALLEQQGRLAQLNQWLDIALNNMARGLSMFDRDERLVICNAAYQRLYRLPQPLTRPGVKFAELLEHRESLVADADSIAKVRAAERAALEPGASGATPELRFMQAMRDDRRIEVSVRPLESGGWVALHEDVTERHAANTRIARLARQDTLTDLANRFAFREALDAATETDAPGFALLVIDLDRFKEVNDTLGHPVGDKLLVAVAGRLRENARRSDVVARLGGDEFAMILHDISRRADAEMVANRVLRAMHEPFSIDGQRLAVGGTIGVAMAPADGTDADTLMKHADIALYRAKGDTRGSCRFFAPEMEGALRNRRRLEADLAAALANDEFELRYQPIISLVEGRVVGCEALIRWHHPERGMVSPAEFIPLAEETGMIVSIGAWALKEACQAAVLWPGRLRVAVNLSVAQFTGPDLAALARAALDESGLPPQRLELEVTESLLLGHDAATLELLHRLRDLGVAIALDDFGTGYSSLSHLRSFPFDKLKIDQTFVRDLPDRTDCEAIVGAVARLAESLEMRTVAEGVESEQHLARVQAAGCHEVQGYLFSPPVVATELPRVLGAINARLSSGLTAA